MRVPSKQSDGDGKRRVLPIAVVMFLIAAGWWYVQRPGDEPSAPSGDPTPSATATVSDDPTGTPTEAVGDSDVALVGPIEVELADGRTLTLALGLQVAGSAADFNDTLVRDAAITLYGGRSAAEVVDPATRDELRDELQAEVVERYDGQVVALYLTQYET